MLKRTKSKETQEAVREAVRKGYGEIARKGGSFGGGASCCGSSSAAQVAQAAGYSEAELAALPEGANMGLSCGNPTAIASLAAGEVVLDLGSGGGFDVFVAGRKVGPTGRVIGVDMTADMIAKARANIAAYRKNARLDNVEFRLGEIEHLPAADASVDVVISNCVLNLSPEKEQVWREIARVLRPGGRVAVSDIALLRSLPRALRQAVESLVGCVAGAVLADETHRMAEEAGLAEIVMTPKPGYADSMADWNDPLYRKILKGLPAGTKVGDYITSLDVAARRGEAPAACCGKPTAPKRRPSNVYTPAVGELVAIGAAIAANCEPCFRHHFAAARKFGVSREEIALAVAMAKAVKEAPARAVLEVAEKYLKCSATAQEAGASTEGTCCGTPAPTPMRKSSGGGRKSR